MSSPDYLRLYTAALSLAASFEHAFPDGVRRRVEWGFLVEADWRDLVDLDPVISIPMNRWGAFLHDPHRCSRRERYQQFELFELMVEEIVELRGIISALSSCRVQLRRAIAAANKTPRELLVFARLFRQLRRTPWTIDGGLCLRPLDSDGLDNWCTVEVRPPSVALVREMAHALGYDRQQPAPDARIEEIFIPTVIQKLILEALVGKAMRTKALVEVVKVDQGQMFREMKELRRRGSVLHHTRLGFFRPDFPPPALADPTSPGRRATN
jgi:hypothetical protein